MSTRLYLEMTNNKACPCTTIKGNQAFKKYCKQAAVEYFSHFLYEIGLQLKRIVIIDSFLHL